VPLAMLERAGVRAIDWSAAGSTVKAAWAAKPFSVARTVAIPGASPVADPAGETLAVSPEVEVQVTWLVKSVVEPSDKVPVAVSATGSRFGMFRLAGLTLSESSAAGLTVSAARPVTPAKVAVIVVLPGARPVTTPVFRMLATEGVAEAQVTRLVRSCVESSEN